MILDRQFYIDYEACGPGYKAVLELGLIDKPMKEVIEGLINAGELEHASWLDYMRTSERYIRQTGGVLMSDMYVVFNPLTGQHVKCNNEIELTTVYQQIGKDVMKHMNVVIVHELSNPDGDVTWIPIDREYEINVVLK